MKECSSCRQIKPYDAFSVDRRARSGLQSKCKECQRLWRLSNLERIQQQKREYYHSKKNDPEFQAKRHQYYIEHEQEIKIYQAAWRQSIEGRFAEYRSGAKKRAIAWDFTIEQFKLFWRKPCTYCGVDIQTIGLDRLDSSGPYSCQNCVACCQECNRAKGDRDYSEFTTWLNRIYQHMYVS